MTGEQRRLGDQGLLQGPRRRQGRRRRRTSRRPTASWRARTTPTPTRATRPPRRRFKAGRRGLRRRRRRREAQGVRRDARAVRRRRLPAAGSPVAFPAASAVAPAASAPAASTARRPLRRPVRRAAPAAAADPARGAPRPRRRPRDRGHDRLHRRDRGRHGPPAADLRRALPDCQGTGGKPGTAPARLPDLRGRRHGGQLGRRRVLDERDLPGATAASSCTTSPARPATAAAAAPSSRTIQARIPAGVKDGQRIRLQGQGRRRRARRPGRRPVRHGARCAAPALRPQGRQPHPRRAGHASTRPRSAPRSRCPTLGGAPVTLRIPAGTPNGRAFRVRGRGCAAQGRHARATCSSPSRSTCPPRSTSRSARGRSRPTARPRDGHDPRADPVRGAMRCRREPDATARGSRPDASRST